MSYDISLYRIETKEKEQATNDDSFFENTENFGSLYARAISSVKRKIVKLRL